MKDKKLQPIYMVKEIALQKVSLKDPPHTIERRTSIGVDKGDENQERGNWSGKLDFLLSMLGWSVGLGNVWRFPYLCYKNGGGVFLIPYLISMVLIGLPMFFLEVSLGQFSSQGTMSCWGFCPLFKGLGFAMCFISFVTCIYYNVLIAYAFRYLFSSFTSYLPWTDCDNAWNFEGCSLNHPVVNCSEYNYTSFDNGTCYNDTSYVGLWNISVFENMTGIRRVSPSEEYFNNEFLAISGGIDEIGSIQWKLLLCFILSWVVTFFCLLKGIKTTGKVVYVTATFPYVVLIILLIRGSMLSGAVDGVTFYIKPDWSRLGDSQVWRDAATQIFYSMGMGWGGLHALSSYNKFHNNVMRDAIIVAVGTCSTSIFAGFVVFSYLGVMAKSMGVTIADVATSGPGLAFVVYPEAFTYLPFPTVWSILFFIMLLTVGLDSQFVTLETVLTSLQDEIKYLRSKKIWLLAAICTIQFILGLPIVTQGGIYILQLLDTFTSFIGLPFVLVLEAGAVSYIYGSNRFYNDIRIMIGRKPSWFWKMCWMVANPVFVSFILIFTLVKYNRYKYGQDYTYPIWAEVCAWILTATPIVIVAAGMIFIVMRSPGPSFFYRVKSLLRPSREWGPFLTKHRMLVDYVSDFVVEPKSDIEQPLTDLTELVIVEVTESSQPLTKVTEPSQPLTDLTESSQPLTDQTESSQLQV